jgi:hydroxyethylthiazole kinase
MFCVANGQPVMTRVTGIGCGLTAVAAAFCAVSDGMLLKAVTAGCAFYGLCGDLAINISNTPGSFFTAFLDTLYSAGEKDIQKLLQVKEI